MVKFKITLKIVLVKSMLTTSLTNCLYVVGHAQNIIN